MPLEFFARCSDCSYDWCGLWWSEGIYRSADAPKATFSCPACFVTFSVPTDYFEGITPDRWLSSHEREIAANPWITRLAELIRAVPRKSPYLFDFRQALAGLRSCPKCEHVLVDGHIEFGPLVCPQCKSQNAWQYGGGDVVSVMERVLE